MTFKLNKTIKTQIADKATADKFLDRFEQAVKRLADKCEKEFYHLYHNEDFEGLPSRALPYLERSTTVDLRGAYKIDLLELGIGHVLNHPRGLRWIKMSKPIVGPQFSFSVSTLEGAADIEWKALRDLVKECAQFRETLLAAMWNYRSAAKMFADLPWSEEYYPESAKKVSTALVPIETILKANELMGV